MKKIVILNNKSDWDLLLQEPSDSLEIIIFKLSPYCGTSALCEKMFDEWFSNLNRNYEITCAKLDVVAARPLSQYIAAEYKVKHESPQVIWLDKNKKVKWHNSHFAITDSALTDLLN
jgi:bacillithiol system protein YtxJ